MSCWDTWDGCISQSCGRIRHILLGNGYSISASSDFRYESLHSKMDFTEIPNLSWLFNIKNTFDFEVVLRDMDIAALVSDAYNETTWAAQLRNDKNVLARKFVDTICAIHPDNLYSYTRNVMMSDDNFAINSGFLANFIGMGLVAGTVFTLNYDLLLYWSALHGFRACSLNLVDGFKPSQSGLFWNPNVMYLHGALHLRTDEYGEPYKIIHTDTNILETVVNDILYNNIYPLVVFEGSSHDKLKKIKNDKYLTYCYEHLSGISDWLFTYGVSFSENDYHIVDAIVRSKVDVVVIGVYCSTQLTLQKLPGGIYSAISKLEQYGKHVILVPTQLMQIW